MKVAIQWIGQMDFYDLSWPMRSKTNCCGSASLIFSLFSSHSDAGSNAWILTCRWFETLDAFCIHFVSLCASTRTRCAECEGYLQIENVIVKHVGSSKMRRRCLMRYEELVRAVSTIAFLVGANSWPIEKKLSFILFDDRLLMYYFKAIPFRVWRQLIIHSILYFYLFDDLQYIITLSNWYRSAVTRGILSRRYLLFDIYWHN